MLHPTLAKMNVPERKSDNFNEIDPKIYKNVNNSLKSQESTKRSSFQERYETQYKTAKTGSVKGNKLPHETENVQAKILSPSEKLASQSLELSNLEKNDGGNSKAILSGFHQGPNLILPSSVTKPNSNSVGAVSSESDKSETDDSLMDLSEEDDSYKQNYELLTDDVNDIANPNLMRKDALQADAAIKNREYVVPPRESKTSGLEKTGNIIIDAKIENSELDKGNVQDSVTGIAGDKAVGLEKTEQRGTDANIKNIESGKGHIISSVTNITGDELVGLDQDKESIKDAITNNGLGAQSVDENSSFLSAELDKNISGNADTDDLPVNDSNTAKSIQSEQSIQGRDITLEKVTAGQDWDDDEIKNTTSVSVDSVLALNADKNEPKSESPKVIPEASSETTRTRQAGLEQKLQSNKINVSSVEQNAIRDSAEMEQDFKQQVQQRVDVSKKIVEIPVRQPVGHSEWAKSIGDKMMMMVSRNMKVANIRLDPPNLGLMEVKIIIGQDQQTQINFVSQHAQVREVLEAEIPRLRQMMEEQGINLLDVNVSDQQQNSTSEFSDRQNEGKDLAHGEDMEQSDEMLDEIGLGLIDHYV